jgi:hypothetical protein
MLKYKGYTGHVESDDESGIFHGEVLDLRDVITSQGKTVEEIEKAFRASMDDKTPFRPLNGPVAGPVRQTGYAHSSTASIISIPNIRPDSQPQWRYTTSVSQHL